MNRGDVYRVALNPVEGREQEGTRPVLVVSPDSFNRLGPPLVAPITQGGQYSRMQGFAVSLSGSGMQTSGVVLCNQLRVMDLASRKGVFLEKAPREITDEVLAKIAAIFE